MIRWAMLIYWWQTRRVYAAWKVLTSQKHWVFVGDGRKELLQIASKGWKVSQARQMVREIHGRVFYDKDTPAAVDQAKDIINKK